jgi:hypothetical protein
VSSLHANHIAYLPHSSAHPMHQLASLHSATSVTKTLWQRQKNERATIKVKTYKNIERRQKKKREKINNVCVSMCDNESEFVGY